MKKEITIPIQVHDLQEKDILAADEHRKKYSIARDLLAEDFNRAIVSRLAKAQEKIEYNQNEELKQVRCKKCGKKFSVGITTDDSGICPECEENI
jgi:hypothetical protein